MATIVETIEADALAPAEIQNDAGRIKEHPLPDLIKADQYSKAVAAGASSRSGWSGLRPARLRLPSPVGPGAET